MASDQTPSAVRHALGSTRALPGEGVAAEQALREAADLLFRHSTFNGHPRFFGYITSSPAPIGMLGDLLAAAINQNAGAYKLAPMATEMESQTVRWIAELIGFPSDCGGLLVSGGTMANIVCFLAARAAKAGPEVRRAGYGHDGRKLALYASGEAHTWIQKAADMCDLREQGGARALAYLNRLNRELLARVERSGQAFLSNAMLGERFALRACIVNFHTSGDDVDALPELLAGWGREIDRALRASPDPANPPAASM